VHDLVSSSRSQVRKWILEGNVRVNGQTVKPGYDVKADDEIAITFPEPRPLTLVPEAIPLDILFEDDALLVLHKPAGMVVHPAPGHEHGTLVHALLSHCRNLSGIGGVRRPGIVHRLDRDTSGLMLVAKTDEAHWHLSEQLRTRQVGRKYTAIVHGRFKMLTGSIEAPIGRHQTDRKKMAVMPKRGRYARSEYTVVEQFSEHALVHVTLNTGRTHQIRVHMKAIHHAVVGDPVYGNASKNNLQMPRQALHAHQITFCHPLTQQMMQFETPLPADMQRGLDILRRMGT
jgi:23S rRNA pseudouridine1911/1915/1917 synthase